jgi:predicted nucleic acid-binding protein
MNDSMSELGAMAARPDLAPSLVCAVPKLVLDTNVVLDWLLFRNPSCLWLDAAIQGGHVHWLATKAMRDEFDHVLGRGVLDRWRPDAQALSSSWARWSHAVEASPQALTHTLQCTDTDDQKYIDLALQVGAAALLSRDRAVLHLARRARHLGLSIADPETWTLQWRAERPPG